MDTDPCSNVVENLFIARYMYGRQWGGWKLLWFKLLTRKYVRHRWIQCVHHRVNYHTFPVPGSNLTQIRHTQNHTYVSGRIYSCGTPEHSEFEAPFSYNKFRSWHFFFLDETLNPVLIMSSQFVLLLLLLLWLMSLTSALLERWSATCTVSSGGRRHELRSTVVACMALHLQYRGYECSVHKTYILC